MVSFFYEAIQIEVLESGCYDFIGNSTFDTYVNLYKDHFDPILPTNNLLLEISGDLHDHRFELQTSLLIDRKYIFVVTTLFPNATGIFSVIANGRNRIKFNRIGECFSFQLLLTFYTS